MVRIEIRSIRYPDPIAVVEASGDAYEVVGDRLHLIDPQDPLIGLPSGNRVTAGEAPEEWARGLAVRFRSPDLSARIVHDDDSPLTQQAPIELHIRAAFC